MSAKRKVSFTPGDPARRSSVKSHPDDKMILTTFALSIGNSVGVMGGIELVTADSDGPVPILYLLRGRTDYSFTHLKEDGSFANCRRFISSVDMASFMQRFKEPYSSSERTVRGMSRGMYFYRAPRDRRPLVGAVEFFLPKEVRCT